MPELTAEDELELERLCNELLKRVSRINSVIARTQVGTMRDKKLLNEMRFFNKHWAEGISMRTVNSAYNGAKLLGNDPLTTITKNDVEGIQELVERGRNAGVPFNFGHVEHGIAALVIQHPTKLELIISLMTERRIISPDEIAEFIEDSDESLAPLKQGVL